MEQNDLVHIKIESASLDLMKCSEIFRNNLSGKYFYFCYHCGNEYDSDQQVIAHIEAEHILKTEVYDADVKLEDTNLDDGENNPTLQVRQVESSLQNNDNSTNLYDCDQFPSSNCNENFSDILLRPKDDYSSGKYMANECIPIETIIINDQAFTKEYQCDHCQQVFKTKDLLGNHMNLHRDSAEVFNCNWCDKSFDIKRRFQYHRRTAHAVEWRTSKNYRLLLCDICNKTFTDKFKLKVHMNSIHSVAEGPNHCQYCGRYYTLRESLKRHIEEVHIANTICHVCNETFEDVEKCKEHKRLHSLSSNCNENFSDILLRPKDDYYSSGKYMANECTPIETIIINDQAFTKEYQCDHCQQVFKTKDLLGNHMTLHRDIVEVFNCNWCDKSFDNKRRFQYHRRKAHEVEWRTSKNYRLLLCDICNKTFTDKFKLEVHMNSIHSVAEGPNHCQYCGRYYRLRESLKRHIEEVHIANTICHVCNETFDDVEKCKEHKRLHSQLESFKCNICEKVVKTYAYLKSHKKGHNVDRLHKCTVCFAAFKHIGNLKIHHINRHTAEKIRYNCDVCDNSYSTASSLKIHNRTHTGEKPYQCPICGLKYSYTAHLNRHMKSHEVQLAHQCEICEKKISSARGLKNHKQIHTGLRPYKCEICDRAFSQRNGLRHHKLLHQDEKRFKCKYCDMTFAQASGRRGHEKNKHFMLL